MTSGAAGFDCMIVLTHIAWGPARVTRIVLLSQPRDTQVRDLQVPVHVQDDVLRLDVAVDDFVLVKVLKAEKDARNEEP